MIFVFPKKTAYGGRASPYVLSQRQSETKTQSIRRRKAKPDAKLLQRRRAKPNAEPLPKA
jgi:hypothetical protein